MHPWFQKPLSKIDLRLTEFQEQIKRLRNLESIEEINGNEYNDNSLTSNGSKYFDDNYEEEEEFYDEYVINHYKSIIPSPNNSLDNLD